MDMFEEIYNQKIELPKINSIEKSIGKQKFNGYQKFSIITFIICFIFGIVLGNLFPACSSSTYLYSDACLVTEFNFFLMIVFWFASLILCLFFYSIGHIIELLTSIDKKLK